MNTLQDLDQNAAKEAGKSAWYAVQVSSGCEKKVKTNLLQRAQTLQVADRILQVAIPERAAIKVKKDGSKASTEEKILPGYVLVHMLMDDEAWGVVKGTPNVINFVGTEERRGTGRGRGHVTPRPLSQSEIRRTFMTVAQEEPVVRINLAVGDKVEVIAGPFQDFNGEVVEVSPERGRLTAHLSIFGRDTPVELEFNQIRRIE
ncbi:transcription termination/antitermination protein NusG [Anthocerotibacter panamensis]|uniref:transcription termination/antitermination protein NusG n=1 Tax=Anthocerotibacter panamensis TaxID=2857077 RepID=UPI001C406842|nr:transcription termination/antitermination protein NusG [Anthocerotibacter panamensis]